MKKFSRKEKIVLIIFGVILVAIIIQMVVWLGDFRSSPPEGITLEETEIDFSGNLLKPEDVKLTASSHNVDSQTVDSMIDNKRDTFWHVALDKVKEPAWVTVDFGEGNTKKVQSLMALPRQDIPQQFFRSAELFGSNNGEDWEPISKIIQGERPGSATWKEWKFENDQAFRFYKLAISNGHEGGKFFSMAELVLSE